jgi:hypothetical protein
MHYLANESVIVEHVIQDKNDIDLANKATNIIIHNIDIS